MQRDFKHGRRIRTVTANGDGTWAAREVIQPVGALFVGVGWIGGGGGGGKDAASRKKGGSPGSAWRPQSPQSFPQRPCHPCPCAHFEPPGAALSLAGARLGHPMQRASSTIETRPHLFFLLLRPGCCLFSQQSASASPDHRRQPLPWAGILLLAKRVSWFIFCLFCHVLRVPFLPSGVSSFEGN